MLIECIKGQIDLHGHIDVS